MNDDILVALEVPMRTLRAVREGLRDAMQSPMESQRRALIKEFMRMGMDDVQSINVVRAPTRPSNRTVRKPA